MGLKLHCFLVLVVLAIAEPLFAEDIGCMDVPTFTRWAEVKPSLYRAASARARSIQRGYKQLKQGMTLEEGLKGCTWYYLTKSSDWLNGTGVEVRFNSDGKVNAIGKGGILGPVTQG